MDSIILKQLKQLQEEMSSITLEASDIEIGAVELKDADGAVRTKIADASTIGASDNALAVADANVKAAADAIQTAIELIDDSVGTNDSAAPSKSLQTGLRAESTIPTEVDDGDTVPAWADTFGRQILAGFSTALDSLNVQEVSPWASQTLEQTLLDAVTATGASSSINTLNYRYHTFHVTASSVSTGATVKIQTSNDGTNWFDKATHSIGSDGTYETVISNEIHKYLRANVTSRTDGTYTVTEVSGA